MARARTERGPGMSPVSQRLRTLTSYAEPQVISGRNRSTTQDCEILRVCFREEGNRLHTVALRCVLPRPLDRH
jgi:hypothetical protein